MWGLKLAALIVVLGLALTGCQDTGEVENQAYVLVLAIDRAEDGALALTVRVPRIGSGGSKSDKADSGGSPYLTFSVSAPSWSRALDELQWATPRRINLSHIETVVASEELAAQPSFPELMNAIADTPHLYTNARLVICAGSARAFLEAGETVIGARLSSEIRTMLSQYARQGYIPDACLAEACYCANGIYGDPIAIWAELEEYQEGADASGIMKTPMRQRFSGTALFHGGRFVHALSRAETRLLGLIRGQCATLTYMWRNEAVELSVHSVASKALVRQEDVILSLQAALSAPDGLSDADRSALEASVRGDILRLISACQRLGVDPFGFAESAAGHFTTVGQWTAFDWKSHYVRAAADIDVRILSSHANP